jgi:hypothetical protein
MTRRGHPRCGGPDARRRAGALGPRRGPGIIASMGFSWDLNGIFMGFEWDFNGDFHGILMGFSWDFHGILMVIFMGFEWDFNKT